MPSTAHVRISGIVTTVAGSLSCRWHSWRRHVGYDLQCHQHIDMPETASEKRCSIQPTATTGCCFSTMTIPLESMSTVGVFPEIESTLTPKISQNQSFLDSIVKLSPEALSTQLKAGLKRFVCHLADSYFQWKC
jgi:hypothetical protein